VLLYFCSGFHCQSAESRAPRVADDFDELTTKAVLNWNGGPKWVNTQKWIQNKSSHLDGKLVRFRGIQGSLSAVRHCLTQYLNSYKKYFRWLVREEFPFKFWEWRTGENWRHCLPRPGKYLPIYIYGNFILVFIRTRYVRVPSKQIRSAEFQPGLLTNCVMISGELPPNSWGVDTEKCPTIQSQTILYIAYMCGSIKTSPKKLIFRRVYLSVRQINPKRRNPKRKRKTKVKYFVCLGYLFPFSNYK